MDYQPLNDKILVNPVSASQEINGLFIPDNSTNLKKGEVVAICEGKDGQPFYIGQTVLFKKGVGEEITLDGKKYLLFNERDIWMQKKHKQVTD